MDSENSYADFSVARFTAIISDLHLCEEEELHSKYPLWKKYKTKQYFFDDEFRNWLESLVESAGTLQVVLAGKKARFTLRRTALPLENTEDHCGPSHLV